MTFSQTGSDLMKHYLLATKLMKHEISPSDQTYVEPRILYVDMCVVFMNLTGVMKTNDTDIGAVVEHRVKCCLSMNLLAVTGRKGELSPNNDPGTVNSCQHCTFTNIPSKTRSWEGFCCCTFKHSCHLPPTSPICLMDPVFSARISKIFFCPAEWAE